MTENKKKLQDTLSYQFINEEILERALTHKSYNKFNNNEQLEFLGDRVLGVVIAEEIFKEIQNSNEGILDKKYSKLVNKIACFEVAKDILLGNYIKLGSTEKASDGNKKLSILADTCEAILGAIYLDAGFLKAREIILKLWKKQFLLLGDSLIDAKSFLQEWTLKKSKDLPKYNVIEKNGPDHNPVFKVEIKYKKYDPVISEGASIKEAEMKAAEKFIKKNNIV